jgi:hypothetical protein
MCKNDKNVKDFEIPHIFIWIDILQHEKKNQKPNPKWLFLVHAH